MRGRLRKSITYANVVATLALCLAVGMGGAYAATKLSKNAVKTKNIKNNAVTNSKIADGAVTNGKVAAGTLGADRLSATGQLDLKGPLAYGQTNDNGAPSLVTQRTSGITTITNPAAGVYCLGVASNIAAKVFEADGDPLRPTVATVEFGNTDAPETSSVTARGANAICGPNLLEFETYTAGAADSDVSFTVIVP